MPNSAAVLRWNLLHEVVEIFPGRLARVTAQEPADVFTREFLWLEIMAQTAGLVLGSLDDFKSDVVFAKVESAEFYKPCVAPLYHVEARGEDLRAEGGWLNAQVRHEGELIAQARLMLANAGHLKSSSLQSITFHDSFMSHYKVRQKIRTGVCAS